MIIYTNDFIELLEQNGIVLLQTNKAGFPLKEIDMILRQYPRIRLTNFAGLKNALVTKSEEPVEIGKWLPNIELEIAKDRMYASVFINEPIDELKNNIEKITSDINTLLTEHHICHGIKELQIEQLKPGKSYVIAEGTPPKKGEDAKITYIEIPERKPIIREDGKADYFEMNFVLEIQEGDWVGEKTRAQLGVDGMTIFGDPIPAPPGHDAPLKYDPKSIYEVEKEDKIILYANKTGVLEIHQGVIAVNNHLPIDGDVGIETGNITFDGSVTIKGTVGTGYSVIATGDISIEGREGITGAKLIKSESGDIFIKGGIFGLDETIIEAGGNIFVKHVNNAKLLAKKEIVIGYYSIGSTLSANSILLDENKGKIIGGEAVAKQKIVTAISGNRLERRTALTIKNLNRQTVYEQIQEKASLLKKTQEEIIDFTSKIDRISANKDKFNAQQLQSLEDLKMELERKKAISKEIDLEIKLLMNEAKETGKEEIVVTKFAYPGTIIQIGKKSSLLNHTTQGKFRLESGELNV